MTTSISRIIETAMDSMTDLELTMAQHFLQNDLAENQLSSIQLMKELHVSQAGLTRFAKKCGFKGYREFVFEYLKAHRSQDPQLSDLHDQTTKKVFMDYRELMDLSYSLIDEAQLQRIAQMIEQVDRVYFYGKGSSALVAKESKLRLMRLGVVCEAVSDSDSFTWTTSIINDRCLVIAFSLSAQTTSVIEALAAAHQKGAKTVLVTTQAGHDLADFTELVPVASSRNLNYGNRISPQFPMLIMMDALYAYFLHINQEKKESIFKETIR